MEFSVIFPTMGSRVLESMWCIGWKCIFSDNRHIELSMNIGSSGLLVQDLTPSSAGILKCSIYSRILVVKMLDSSFSFSK